jgi:hypothetical protein
MNSEPALIIGAIEALLVLGISFGVPITPDQKAAVVGFASAVIAVVGSVVIRQNVTPTK